MAQTFFRVPRALGMTTRAAHSFATAYTQLSVWNEARRTRAELSKLSAHELDDIGLSKGDIDRITGHRF